MKAIMSTKLEIYQINNRIAFVQDKTVMMSKTV